MGKVSVVLNKNAVRQFLKSPEVKRKCMDVANQIADKCGAGYEVQERNYPERSGAIVLPTTYQAKKG